ncbi:MAG TPA: DUF4837 family protein [Bacteroidales bacterium]|jgi:hypothetical protein|nr:DUF4837 family protein [Bacteroidales bacterium]HNU21446.1 DUF4837 family protein [Bacteroidales bacterium]HNV16948.1 DUF4837 family protein [Bacteroidales bacterium]HNZ79082.1 DUF4837 family protein [Bacteroidales bacterium]HOC15504.1 DUF4837 family protein [Bacteroidales bacterium]
MKKLLTVIIVFLSLITATSCSKSSSKKSSTGGTLEVLVVTDSHEQWNGKIGDTIRSLFARYIPCLPMPEESFTPLPILSKTLYENDMYKAHHNIFIVSIDPKLTKPSINLERNYWAEPQLIIHFSCPSDTSFFCLFNQYYPSLYELYREVEKDRIQKLFTSNPAKEIITKLQSKYGIDMLIPGGFTVAREEENFIWIRQTIHRRKQDTETGFLVYYRPYTDTAQFNGKNIIRTRDSITRKYIPGAVEGSYMATSVDVIPPQFKRTSKFSTGFAVETRGLWKVVNDFMGGPFISYTFADTKRQRIVTVEGYLYHPNSEQRKYMLQIESLLNTAKVYDEQEQQNVPTKK